MECAACGKRPADDATVRLTRVNVKGVRGVFICQWCVPVVGENRWFLIAERLAIALAMARRFIQTPIDLKQCDEALDLFEANRAALQAARKAGVK